MATRSSETIGAKELLRNVSNEVAHWAQVAERLDDMIGRLPMTADDDVSELGSHLQNMDALRQALRAIAQLTSSAADHFPTDAKVLLSQDALAVSVTMESVRNACLRTEAQAQEEACDLQEIHFF